MIIFNEETKDIVDIKHICYFTKKDSQIISLHEIIEKKLMHPNAKDLAYVYKYDERKLAEYNRHEMDAAATVLLEATQNNINIKLIGDKND
jgi:hypothetical protein